MIMSVPNMKIKKKNVRNIKIKMRKVDHNFYTTGKH